MTKVGTLILILVSALANAQERNVSPAEERQIRDSAKREWCEANGGVPLNLGSQDFSLVTSGMKSIYLGSASYANRVELPQTKNPNAVFVLASQGKHQVIVVLDAANPKQKEMLDHLRALKFSSKDDYKGVTLMLGCEADEKLFREDASRVIARPIGLINY